MWNEIIISVYSVYLCMYIYIYTYVCMYVCIYGIYIYTWWKRSLLPRSTHPCQCQRAATPDRLVIIAASAGREPY